MSRFRGEYQEFGFRLVEFEVPNVHPGGDTK